MATRPHELLITLLGPAFATRLDLVIASTNHEGVVIFLVCLRPIDAKEGLLIGKGLTRTAALKDAHKALHTAVDAVAALLGGIT